MLRVQSANGEGGSRVGRYLLQAPMGSGGTGTVFHAIDTSDGSPTAVKVAHDTQGWQRELLRREVALLARLGRDGGQDGVVRLLDHGVEAGQVWYAMELIRGIDLGVLMDVLASERRVLSLATTGVYEGTQAPARALPSTRQDLALVLDSLGLVAQPGAGPVGPRRLVAGLRLVARIARILAHIHAQAVVHADLAPGNIIVRLSGMPVLVDFGTSFYTFVDGIAREAPQGQGGRHGTPGFMAPEQIRSEPLDARCDLYALGCICYELLTGQPPFAGDARVVQRLHLEAHASPPSAHVPELPAEVDELVMGLLRKDLTRRIGFAEDVLRVLAPWMDADDVPGPAPVATGLRLYRSRLHGRDQPLVALRRRLDPAQATRGGFVLVTGESGLGKTRLLNEIGGLAASRGWEVIVGQCRGSSEDRRSQGAPLEPLLSAVRKLADKLFLSSRPIPADVGEALAALKPFEPSLQAFPGISAIDLPVLPNELARDRVLRALLTCLRALPAGPPVLLLLDDLQWADELTKAFIGSPRIKELGAGSVLIVGTYREDEIEAAFAAACDRVCDECVRLDRLERHDIAALAHDMTASATLPEGLVDDVFRASEGNPFFAAECLRSGLDQGIYRRDEEGCWHATSPATLHAGYQAGGQSIGRYLLPRLARLTARARRVAEVAAILGRELEAETLLSLLPGEDAAGATRAAIEELMLQRLLEEPAPGTLRFVHDKLREGCEEVMSPEQRQATHRRAAMALEHLHGPSASAAIAARLGRHWVEAGEPERAAAYLEQAALAFARVNAIEQATELYGRALGQLELVSVESSAGQTASFATRRAVMSEALGDLLAMRARHAEARERYLQANQYYPDGEQLARARVLRKSGRSHWTVHQYDDAASALTRAQSLLQSGPADLDALETAREKIEIAQNQFWIAYFGRRFGPSVDELLARMDRETAQYGTARQRGIFEKCAAMYKLVHARFRPSPAVIEHSRRSLALLEADSTSAVDAIEARFSLGFALVSSRVDDCKEALALFQACAESAQLLGDMTNLARALAYSAVGLRRLGLVADTVAMAERTRAAAQEAQLLPYLGVACSCLAWAAWRRSERPDDDPAREARRLVDEARGWWKRAGHPFPFRWLAELVAVALAAGADAPSSAVEPLTVLAGADQFHLPDSLYLAITSARLACGGGDVEAAQRSLDEVLVQARRTGF